jgi:hypothetical protein
VNFTAKTPPLSSSNVENFFRAAPLILLLPSISKIMCTLGCGKVSARSARSAAEVPFDYPIMLHVSIEILRRMITLVPVALPI